MSDKFIFVEKEHILKAGGVSEGVVLSLLIMKSNIKSGEIGYFECDWHEIAKDTFLTRRQIDRIVSKLEAKGLIEFRVKKHDGVPTRHFKMLVD